MAGRDNIHSRIVFWLKLALPLAGLAILSSLFLLARSNDPDRIGLAPDPGVEERAESQSLGKPVVTGVTKDGAALTVVAEKALPGLGDAPATADRITATYERKDGFRADLSANGGVFDKAQQNLTLNGSVHVTLSNGMTLDTETLLASMTESRLESKVPVAVTAPYGRIDAGGMLYQQSGADIGEVLVFNGGVRLIYEPKARE
ncbi:MAG: hypothetical protein RLZZ528_2622 [Pseudomonadota bacterium]